MINDAIKLMRIEMKPLNPFDFLMSYRKDSERLTKKANHCVIRTLHYRQRANAEDWI